MKYMRAVMLGVALVGSGAMMVPAASAQVLVPVQRYQDYDDRQAFREGFRQGAWDARNGNRPDWRNNRWREEDDQRAFREGYIRGYRTVTTGYRFDDDDDDHGYNGREREHVADYARRMGREDGFNVGLNDRQTGHSYRPTHNGTYRHADRGYDGRFISRSDYKAFYREGYLQGYQQGYNNGPWQRR